MPTPSDRGATSGGLLNRITGVATYIEEVLFLGRVILPSFNVWHLMNSHIRICKLYRYILIVNYHLIYVYIYI